MRNAIVLVAVVIPREQMVVSSYSIESNCCGIHSDEYVVSAISPLPMMMMMMMMMMMIMIDAVIVVEEA